MDQLLGEFPAKLDAKGRFALPSAFRNYFVEGVAISRAQDKCLKCLSVPDYQARLKGLTAKASGTRQDRNIVRAITSGTRVQNLDSQGRVLLTDQLRTYASLDKEIVIIGVGSAAEIWSKEGWEEVLAEGEAALELSDLVF